MGTAIKWVLGALAILVVIGGAIYGIGAAQPREHVARAERLIDMPTDAVAARLRDVAAYPNWRSGVTVEIVSQTPEALDYVEIADGERIAYRRIEPWPGRFVSTITDETLPFGGAWTITLEPRGAQTLVKIEENGEVRDPIYRFFARFVFGYTSSMEAFLAALAASA